MRHVTSGKWSRWLRGSGLLGAVQGGKCVDPAVSSPLCALFGCCTASFHSEPRAHSVMASVASSVSSFAAKTRLTNEYYLPAECMTQLWSSVQISRAVSHGVPGLVRPPEWPLNGCLDPARSRFC